MKYISTRGGMTPQTFGHILLEGLAPDGGLAVPEHYPRVSEATLEQWRELSYADLALEMLALYITEVPRADLARLCQAPHDPSLYSGRDKVHVTSLRDQLSSLGVSQSPS